MKDNEKPDWNAPFMRVKLVKQETGNRGSFWKVLDAPNGNLNRMLGRGGIKEHRRRSIALESIEYEFKYSQIHESAYRLFENWAHLTGPQEKLCVKLTLKQDMDFYQPSEVYAEPEGEMEKDLRRQAEGYFVEQEGGQIIRIKIGYENTTSAFQDFIKQHFQVDEA